MNRVRNSPNARFILTTRAYILNEAKSASERLSDRRVGVATYVLDLSSYTRAIRQDSYNHLLVRDVPRKYLLALLNSGKLTKIVDHKNYNPRVIEWMTDSTHLEDITPTAYPTAFIAALDNPKALWDKAFRNHISPACRHLLIALFFTPSFLGASISELRAAFGPIHDRLCGVLRLARDPKDFEESLRRLESGFVEIRNGSVDFINPSVRDYLSDYLSDAELLVDLAKAAGSGSAAQQIWNFTRRRLLSPDRQQEVAVSFAHLVGRLETAPQRDFEAGRQMPTLIIATGSMSFSSGGLSAANAFFMMVRSPSHATLPRLCRVARCAPKLLEIAQHSWQRSLF